MELIQAYVRMRQKKKTSRLREAFPKKRHLDSLGRPHGVYIYDGPPLPARFHDEDRRRESDIVGFEPNGRPVYRSQIMTDLRPVNRMIDFAMIQEPLDIEDDE